MDNLTNIVSQSLINYYDLLSNYGYFKMKEVYKLLVLSYIEDLLTSDLVYKISEEDYRYIMQSVNCLLGTNCLLPMPIKKTQDDITHTIKTAYIPLIHEQNKFELFENASIKH